MEVPSQTNNVAGRVIIGQRLPQARNEKRIKT